MIYFGLNANLRSDYAKSADNYEMRNTFHTMIYKYSMKHSIFQLITVEDIAGNSSDNL